MVHVRGKQSIYKQWQSIYKDQVVENDMYNGMIANIANAYIKEGRLVLILVKHINHGKTIESMIPGSIFLSGNSPKKARENGIKSLRNKYISCIVSSSIFDEGIDIKPLDTVILAGQGKSKTRALQRIGRIIRKFEDENGNKKEKATAIDFCIHQKYLKNHAIDREKTYQLEPEFSVEDIDPIL
jgi:superfamily II DNA or RNA helicase